MESKKGIRQICVDSENHHNFHLEIADLSYNFIYVCSISYFFFLLHGNFMEAEPSFSVFFIRWRTVDKTLF